MFVTVMVKVAVPPEKIQPGVTAMLAFSGLTLRVLEPKERDVMVVPLVVLALAVNFTVPLSAMFVP